MFSSLRVFECLEGYGLLSLTLIRYFSNFSTARCVLCIVIDDFVELPWWIWRGLREDMGETKLSPPPKKHFPSDRAVNSRRCQLFPNNIHLTHKNQNEVIRGNVRMDTSDTQKYISMGVDRWQAKKILGRGRGLGWAGGRPHQISF